MGDGMDEPTQEKEISHDSHLAGYKSRVLFGPCLGDGGVDLYDRRIGSSATTGPLV